MEKDVYDKMRILVMDGELEELDEKLKPYIENGDQDAIFLRSHFDLEPDPNLSAEEDDANRAEAMKVLVQQGHAKSQYALAWMYRHGDGVEQNYEKFLILLGLSAVSGNEAAIKDLKVEYELEFEN